ncbi:MAG: protein-glutamate O-methyltransferase CheR [Deferrisomatales bacterium]|nr:protein-glutamate O-methyltransferase CheR [Deferrisomatales bacterium]
MTAQGKHAPELTALFPEFQSFLYEAAGIYFPLENRERLLGHVQARMDATGKRTPKEYLALLNTSRGRGSEQWAFFNQTTVNETFFFRDDVQFAVFKDKLLPELLQLRRRNRQRKLNILSAASSSGEEAYSLAILIQQQFPMEQNFVSITGVDINSDVIDRAKEGLYNRYSVRNCSPQQLGVYFTPEGDKYRVKPDVKQMVSFQVVNLIDPGSLRGLPRPDLILCRNALIYFDKESKLKVIQAFASVLQPHGTLILGRTESLFGLDHPFNLVHFLRSCGYRLKTK